jgi:hypothetical protein
MGYLLIKMRRTHEAGNRKEELVMITRVENMPRELNEKGMYANAIKENVPRS